MNTMNMGRCSACGMRLPPTSAPAHQCQNPFAVILGASQNWCEEAIREIVREEMTALQREAKP